MHLGLISDIKRKSLPAIAEVLGLDSEQGLHHFLTASPWSAEDLEKRRLEIILTILEGKEIIVIIDETGDKKKGKTTDYVKRQYIDNLGKIEKGIVTVNAYGYCQGVVFPLKFKIYKPQERLKHADKYKSKPDLGAELVEELVEIGFNIERVLGDSLYGESATTFLRIIEKLGIEYAVSIRSNHGVWLPSEQRVRVNKWREFEHIRWDSQKEIRYIREIIYGKKRELRYWEIIRDKEDNCSDSSWYVMTKIPNIKYKEVGGIYGVRTWIESGFKNSKNE